MKGGIKGIVQIALILWVVTEIEGFYTGRILSAWIEIDPKSLGVALFFVLFLNMFGWPNTFYSFSPWHCDSFG